MKPVLTVIHSSAKRDCDRFDREAACRLISEISDICDENNIPEGRMLERVTMLRSVIHNLRMQEVDAGVTREENRELKQALVEAKIAVAVATGDDPPSSVWAKIEARLRSLVIEAHAVEPGGLTSDRIRHLIHRIWP